jgi:predicted metal-dependent phosphoesterase TrpH
MLLATAVVLAAVAFFIAFVVPPAPRHVTLSAPEDPFVLKGALHIHTDRSDGGGTLDDVAAAAAAAGLDFVVVTDHGDGRGAEAPSYRHGVLVIDGAEIATDDGHLVTAGFSTPAYRLAGEARDVIEDVHRLGGLAVLAHPTSPKPELAWRAWDVPFDGLEWLNGDSQWRDESAAALARLVLGYPFRPAAAVAAAFDRPTAALARYDEAASRRPVVALAGHDAHARIALAGDEWEEAERGAASRSWWRRGLPLPSYRNAFRSFAVRALVEGSRSGDADADAARVLAALRGGRVYTAIDGLASPARVAFVAQSGPALATIGGRLTPVGPLRFDIRADAPAGSTIVLLRDGEEVLSGPAPALTGELPAVPGAYRAEVRVTRGPGTPPVPWILTSATFVGMAPQEPPAPGEAPGVTVDRWSAGDAASGWTVERQAGSEGSLERARGSDLRLTYRLGPDRAASPYAAAVRPVSISAAATGVALRLRADRPMRVSLQVRAPGEGGGDRWRRSIYVDETERLVRVDFADMRAVHATHPDRPVLSRVDSLLVVVDTVNSEPGAEGRVELSSVELVR